ncbi:hypothetical protein AAF712_006033 [Marasmius tenuissimus]|uniref:Uncharacterized protein n=1 Tax=Marasmius tenuissimus TaxID=585030 RepID=A0ABR2ZZM0_9AGAR
MSSLEPTDWGRKLRSGKEFSPIVIEHVNISELLWAAALRQVETESNADTQNPAATETYDMADVDFASLGLEPITRKRRNDDDDGQSHTNSKRARKRAKLADLVSRASQTPRVVDNPFCTSYVSSNLPSKGDGYSAKAVTSKEIKDGDREYSLDELQREQGFDIVEWDGSEHKTITDARSTVMVALVTPPDDPTFKEKCDVFHKAILTKRAQIDKADARQPRGNFPAVRQGITYGMGQEIPTWVVDSKYAEIMEDLLNTKEAARIAGYQSAAYARFSPNNYRCYKETKAMLELNPRTKHLRWNFGCSVFASVVINFGPRTWTHKHRDVQNLPHGWCAVTAMGNYDYRRGGHLVLWDLKLIIQFPPGCTILLPSATLLHSNIPVQQGETRTSYTQYSAGALFRWTNHGGRNLGELKSQDKEAFDAHYSGLKAKAGLAGVDRLSTLDELIQLGHLVRKAD